MDKFTPKLLYCLLVSHRTVIEGNYTEAIEVPESVKQVQITVHTYNGAEPRPEQVWRELNAHGYYSHQYSLQSYWQPILNEEPF